MVVQVFGRLALEMRQAGTHTLPVAVEAVTEARNPAEARFDHHHLQLRESLEHAFRDQADDLRLAGIGVLGHFFEINEGQPVLLAARPL